MTFSPLVKSGFCKQAERGSTAFTGSTTYQAELVKTGKIYMHKDFATHSHRPIGRGMDGANTVWCSLTCL